RGMAGAARARQPRAVARTRLHRHDPRTQPVACWRQRSGAAQRPVTTCRPLVGAGVEAGGLTQPEPRAAAGWADLFAEGRLPRFVLICLAVWLNAADALVASTIMPSVG